MARNFEGLFLSPLAPQFSFFPARGEFAATAARRPGNTVVPRGTSLPRPHLTVLISLRTCAGRNERECHVVVVRGAR